MQFGYGDADLGRLIKEYEVISNDEIVITFLDSSRYITPNTKENEKKILETMLQQAKERNESIDLVSKKSDRATNFALISLLFCLDITKPYDSITVKTLGLMTKITALCYFLFKETDRSIRFEEYEKYNIYLQNKDKIESLDEIVVFAGIDNDDLELNINTLDLYSLKELKRIRANIKKEETFSSLPKDTIKILNKRFPNHVFQKRKMDETHLEDKVK